MARGYCSDCGLLVEITTTGEKHNHLMTSRVWRPKPHKDADGKPCTPVREAGEIEFFLIPSHAGSGGTPVN